MRRARHDPADLHLGPLAGPDVALALLLCVAPIVTLIVVSFGTVDPVTLDTRVTGVVDSYRTLLSPEYRPVIARSYGLAAAAVALAAGLGIPTALALTRLSEVWQRRALVAVVAPSFVNFAVRIFAWQGLLAESGPVNALIGEVLLYRPPAVLIGMITAYVPIFLLPAYVACSRVEPSLLDAAADLGARRFRRTVGIVLPLAAPGLITGAVLVGVLAVGEFIVPAVLGGGKVLLLGSILAERGAGRGRPLAGAIVTMMLVTVAIGGLIIVAARRRWGRL